MIQKFLALTVCFALGLTAEAKSHSAACTGTKKQKEDCVRNKLKACMKSAGRDKTKEETCRKEAAYNGCLAKGGTEARCKAKETDATAKVAAAKEMGLEQVLVQMVACMQNVTKSDRPAAEACKTAALGEYKELTGNQRITQRQFLMMLKTGAEKAFRTKLAECFKAASTAQDKTTCQCRASKQKALVLGDAAAAEKADNSCNADSDEARASLCKAEKSEETEIMTTCMQDASTKEARAACFKGAKEAGKKLSTKTGTQTAGRDDAELKQNLRAGAVKKLREHMESCMDGADALGEAEAAAKKNTCLTKAKKTLGDALGKPDSEVTATEVKQAFDDVQAEVAGEEKSACMSEGKTSTQCMTDVAKRVGRITGQRPDKVDRTDVKMKLQKQGEKLAREAVECCMKSAGKDRAKQKRCAQLAKSKCEEIRGKGKCKESDIAKQASTDARSLLKECQKSATTKEAKKKCADLAKEKYMENGGKEKRYKKEARNAATEECSSDLKECLGDAGDAAAKTKCKDDFKKCLNEVFDGADEATVKAERKKGAALQSVKKFRACVELEVENNNSTDATAAKKAAMKTCFAKAREEYNLFEGKAYEAEAQMLESRRQQAAADIVACQDADETKTEDACIEEARPSFCETAKSTAQCKARWARFAKLIKKKAKFLRDGTLTKQVPTNRITLDVDVEIEGGQAKLEADQATLKEKVATFAGVTKDDVTPVTIGDKAIVIKERRLSVSEERRLSMSEVPTGMEITAASNDGAAALADKVGTEGSTKLNEALAGSGITVINDISVAQEFDEEPIEEGSSMPAANSTTTVQKDLNIIANVAPSPALWTVAAVLTALIASWVVA